MERAGTQGVIAVEEPGWCSLAGYASGASATGKGLSLVCITLGFLWCSCVISTYN
jgi:hypothetical protein